ncbi:MAG: cupredoxin domain-containing protein [Deltaproteobacteria bacterium]|nr:cupredoxin domain-containing protein [Deltaproteobacteria bacterium]
MRQVWRTFTGVSLGVIALGAIAFTPGMLRADSPHEFTVVNVEYEGTKVFVPSVLVVHKGDTVKIKVINNIKADPPQHGFAIPDFKIEEVVNRGETKEVQFTADKVGVFEIKCQLHPAHVHAQLVVLQ